MGDSLIYYYYIKSMGRFSHLLLIILKGWVDSTIDYIKSNGRFSHLLKLILSSTNDYIKVWVDSHLIIDYTKSCRFSHLLLIILKVWVDSLIYY